MIINVENRLYGKYKIKKIINNDIRLTSTIIKKNTSNLGVKVFVPPINSMHGVYEVFSRPKVTSVFEPIRDSYVTEEIPVFNFGNTQVLRTGTSDKGRFRSFLLFNFKSLPENLKITRASLNLEIVSNNSTDAFNLELSTINKIFDEYGLTWNNQIPRERFLNAIQVDQETKKISIDVTETIQKWYSSGREVTGFLLKQLEEELQQIVTFGSRESSNQPKLEIEYFDPDFKVPFRSSKRVQANLITKRVSNLKLGVKAFFITHRREELKLVKADIYNMRALFVCATINKLNIETKAVLTRRKYSDNVLIKATLTRRYITYPSPLIYAGVTRKHLKTSVNIYAYSKLKAIASITKPNLKVVSINIIKRSCNLDVQANILGRSKLPVQATIANNRILTKANIVGINKILVDAFLINRSESKPLLIKTTVLKEKSETKRVKVKIVRISRLLVKTNILARSHVPVTCVIIKQKDNNKLIKANLNGVKDLPITVNIKTRYLKITATLTRVRKRVKVVRANILGNSKLRASVRIKRVNKIEVRTVVIKKGFDDLKVTTLIVSRYARNKRRAYVFII